VKPISAITVVAWCSILFGVALDSVVHFASPSLVQAVIMPRWAPFLWAALIPPALASVCWWSAPRLGGWGALLTTASLVLTASGVFVGFMLLGE
jgi:hypothetical protein